MPPNIDASAHTRLGLLSWLQDTAFVLVELANHVEASPEDIVPEVLRRDTEAMIAACKDVFRAHARIVRTVEREHKLAKANKKARAA